MTTDVIKQIRRATRRRFTAEEKIRIVLEGLRGETPITELCRQEGIQSSIYYKWSKAFLDSGAQGTLSNLASDSLPVPTTLVGVVGRIVPSTLRVSIGPCGLITSKNSTSSAVC